MKIDSKSIVILLILIITLASLLSAQNPQLLNYQGNLTNKDGTPANGTYDIKFSIYQENTGGADLWHETQKVTVINGIFNVLLGNYTTLSASLFSGKGNRYLGIKVGDEPEMAPRFLLTSVPYALNAAVADSVKDNAITSRKQTITTFKASDLTFKRHTGTGQTKISEFVFNDVPAGDIFVILTCFGSVDLGKYANGTLNLEIGLDNIVQSIPTHILVSERWSQITLHGCMQNFPGGQLVIRLFIEGENAETSLTFGSENTVDFRFGRWVTVMAGL